MRSQQKRVGVIYYLTKNSCEPAATKIHPRPFSRFFNEEGDMYVRVLEGLGQSCPIDLDSISAEQQKFQRIRQAIECELGLRFATPTDPRLHERRQRLRNLFKRVPLAFASKLQRELEEAQSALGKLFWQRLHPATNKEMLAILSQGFFKEYELRFNPLADTFSVDNNSAMKAPQKDLRKKDVNDLIGDVSVNPGILWRRLLAS